MIRLHTLWVALLFFCPAFAQSGGQPDRKELAGTVYFLASPLLEGREAGERGSLIAAEYIASVMEQHGLLPAGDIRSGAADWFQDFELMRNKQEKAKEERAVARNVLGMIKGSDTTKYVVIGAHYDHLGMRGDTIFPGAEDNASGVAGMLALAKRWSSSEKHSPCNLIFAAWTAEEKGQVGSKYFVSHFTPGQKSLLLNVNLDMISRSAPEDTACNILSIGFLKGDTLIRGIATRNNIALGIRFNLDLWEIDGTGGSDYTGFSALGIPVMTFYAGENSDYHSPGDTRNKIDWIKMIKVIQLANSCLEEFLEHRK